MQPAHLYIVAARKQEVRKLEQRTELGHNNDGRNYFFPALITQFGEIFVRFLGGNW